MNLALWISFVVIPRSAVYGVARGNQPRPSYLACFRAFWRIPNLNSPETRVYLDQHAKVVFESYRAKVLLIGGENESTNLTARL